MTITILLLSAFLALVGFRLGSMDGQMINIKHKLGLKNTASDAEVMARVENLLEFEDLVLLVSKANEKGQLDELEAYRKRSEENDILGW